MRWAATRRASADTAECLQQRKNESLFFACLSVHFDTFDDLRILNSFDNVDDWIVRHKRSIGRRRRSFSRVQVVGIALLHERHVSKKQAQIWNAGRRDGAQALAKHFEIVVPRQTSRQHVPSSLIQNMKNNQSINPSIKIYLVLLVQSGPSLFQAEHSGILQSGDKLHDAVEVVQLLQIGHGLNAARQHFCPHFHRATRHDLAADPGSEHI